MNTSVLENEWIAGSEKPVSRVPGSAWLLHLFFLILLTLIAFIVIRLGPAPQRQAAHDIFILICGADRAANGQIPVRDWYSPLGPLYFLHLTWLNQLTGIKWAELLPYRQALIWSMIAIATYLVSYRSLKSLAMIPVTILGFHAISNVNYGYIPSELSYAMDYNRIGHAIIGIIILMSLCRLFDSGTAQKSEFTINTNRLEVSRLVFLSLLISILFLWKVNFYLVSALMALFYCHISAPPDFIEFFKKTFIVFSLNIVFVMIFLSLYRIPMGDLLSQLSIARKARWPFNMGFITSQLLHYYQDGFFTTTVLYSIMLYYGLHQSRQMIPSLRFPSIHVICIGLSTLALKMTNFDFPIPGPHVLFEYSLIFLAIFHLRNGSFKLKSFTQNAMILLLLSCCLVTTFKDVSGYGFHAYLNNSKRPRPVPPTEFGDIFNKIAPFDISEDCRRKPYESWIPVLDAYRLILKNHCERSRIDAFMLVNTLPLFLGSPYSKATHWWHEDINVSSSSFPDPVSSFSETDVLLVPKPHPSNNEYIMLNIAGYYKDYIASHFRPIDESSMWIIYIRNHQKLKEGSK